MPRETNFPSVKKNTIAQITSVSQLSDVQPTDWAFQALQSLVERYGTIAGYSDGTFRGNRALTRYEFAAGLNAALNRLNELIAAGSADLVRQEDLATLQRLQSEFAAELAVLRGRVDALEASAAELEANQFSTTTRLNGEIVVALVSVLNGENANGSNFDRASITNAYGISGTFTLNPNFAIGGWVGYANQRYIGAGDASVWNWAVTLAFPNLGKEGSLGGLLVGMEPKVTSIDSDLNGGRADEDTSLHLEAFYRYQLTDNIQITLV